MRLYVFILLIYIQIGCIGKNRNNISAKNYDLDSVSAENIIALTQHDRRGECNPKIIAATADIDRYVFQAINFNATEESCWNALKSHGQSFCQDKFPCRILYIEKDHLGKYKENPNYPDFDMLKKFGIGEFTKFKEGFGWQLSGADAMSWERNEKGFEYLETGN